LLATLENRCDPVGIDLGRAPDDGCDLHGSVLRKLFDVES
jgi:hypothetical protein